MMRSLFVVLVAGLAGCGAPRVEPTAPSDPPTESILSIVGTNDLHGHIERLPLFAGFLSNLARARGEDGGLLLIDGGDMFQGTIASNLGEGAAVVRAYNALGYDAATVGNHELDYGPVGDAVTPEGPADDPRGALRARAREADFPILTANILDRATGERVHWGENMPPATMITVAGLKVGVVGVSTAETLETTIAGNVADLAMAPLAETITEHARRLRRDGALVVVVSAHAGAACDEHFDPDDLRSCDDGEIFRVARTLEPDLVDVIVAGHTHRGVAHRVNGVAIIESFAYGEAFGRVDLTVRGDRVVESTLHPPRRMCLEKTGTSCQPGSYEGSPVTENAQIAAVIAPDLARAEAMRVRPLGVTLAAPFAHGRSEETPLSRWLADLMREAGGGDVAIVNAGGIRASLPAGPLHYGAFYEAFPFDNRFARVALSGAELEQLIAHDLQSDRGILTLSGVSGHARCEGDTIVVELARSDGRPIGDEERLTILTSDYLATSSLPTFAAAQAAGRVSVEGDEPMREALVALIEEGPETVDPASPLLSQTRLRHPERPMRCPVGAGN